MGRIDIVVFPNGGREVFGQIGEAGAESISAAIEAFLPALESSNRARKYTGYYDAPDASDIEWQEYNENNPIVLVPVETPMPISEVPDRFASRFPHEPEKMAVELLDLPEEMRKDYLPFSE